MRCRAVEEQRRFLSVGPWVEQAGHRLQQTERKGTPLRRMGVQPLVIGGSDSAELDKFQ
jgi:hypothetical protein